MRSVEAGNFALAAMFGCASNLAIYAEDRMLGMNIGRTEGWLEHIALWLSLALQPWIIAVFAIFRLLQIDPTPLATIIAALLTSVLLFVILRRLFSDWPRVYRFVVVLIALATIGTGYSAFAAFRSIRAYNSVPHYRS